MDSNDTPPTDFSEHYAGSPTAEAMLSAFGENFEHPGVLFSTGGSDEDKAYAVVSRGDNHISIHHLLGGESEELPDDARPNLTTVITQGEATELARQ